MRKRSLTLFAVGATLLWAVAQYGAPAMPHDDDDRDRDRIAKTLTFRMPDCPIEATTVSPTKMDFTFPERNPLRAPFSVAGNIQVTDQTSSTVILLNESAAGDDTGVTFSRTVRDLAHMTGDVSFDKGCTRTDPYGSNDCTWAWGESITTAYEGALQEDITAGKLIVDLQVNNTIPLSFTCAVCGARCTVTIPEGIDEGKWDEIWRWMIRLIRFPFDLTQPPFPH